MSEERLTRKIYAAERCGIRKRGRPRVSWLDHVDQILKEGNVRSTRNRRACMRNGMNVNEAKEVCRDRGSWRLVLSAYPSRDTA